jgi:hypothetical protein
MPLILRLHCSAVTLRTSGKRSFLNKESALPERSASEGKGRDVPLIFESLRCSVLAWLSFSLFFFPLPAYAQYGSAYLGVTLSELQTALGKVNGTITFAPRPGSTQGTQEARLPENAGVVQAAGSPGNLSAVVLWLPVDAKGKLASVKSRQYLEAFISLFTDDAAPIVRWTEQVLERAVAEGGSTPHLESQLVEDRQLKVMYSSSLTPPMLSVTVNVGGQSALR